ncbi:hypothetical protein N8371_04545 [Vicingaceae bacterium]|nr:hypothetical protein [Vicingaceae bacterium]MDA9782808.1 hypothetical protein [Vicingaceae bacterium]MDB4061864.1 hypothetical protein [Vicingaceae bacterium]MDC1451658.1 hypothetical protein [Vicingaceae bacterium]
MINRGQLKEALRFLKENNCITIEYNDGIKFIFDAKNGTEGLFQLNSPQQDFGILISSDRMANQCIKDIPEIAWDMMDYAITPLTLVLDGGQFVSKHLITEDGSLSIQKLNTGPLFELVSKYGKPIAFFNSDKNHSIQIDFKIVMKQNMVKEKIVRIRPNGEVEIIAN